MSIGQYRLDMRRRPRVQYEVTELPYAGERHNRSGVRLTVTRTGIEVDGWYDTFVGCGETIFLTWDELDELRTNVNRRPVSP